MVLGSDKNGFQGCITVVVFGHWIWRFHRPGVVAMVRRNRGSGGCGACGVNRLLLGLFYGRAP